ncbi:P-loop containing nucleoside triphosphate hydrolase protein [Limtongia smithiae]|uniref:P-loop containing nucleoside triphosphate hydrolase protein n=1 Tax=Limtongia smithiae TaxID=1125753 RepID=UPI0034CE5595
MSTPRKSARKRKEIEPASSILDTIVVEAPRKSQRLSSTHPDTPTRQTLATAQASTPTPRATRATTPVVKAETTPTRGESTRTPAPRQASIVVRPPVQTPTSKATTLQKIAAPAAPKPGPVTPTKKSTPRATTPRRTNTAKPAVAKTPTKVATPAKSKPPRVTTPRRTSTTRTAVETPTKRTPRVTKSATPSSTSMKRDQIENQLQTPTKSISSQLFAKRTTPVTQRSTLNFTPLPSRLLTTPTKGNKASPHQTARSRLHAANAPQALPCREHEFEEIYGALESAIVSETGTCIYVSGTPGTGKTATVRSVVRYLKAHNDFLFAEINGMKIVQPIHAYEQLWQVISNQRVAAAHALRFLDNEFNNPKLITKPVVVLMDELDQLVTKSQDVMYNFFNWPSLPDSKLIVVAVANIMDLPERTLSNKISSRLGLARIQFAGYTHQQLQIIIEDRLKHIPGSIVLPEAVEFASRKVASVTGDARRALDICRRATEIAEQEARTDTPLGSATRSGRVGGNGEEIVQQVTIQHIRRAINESTSSPVFQFLPTLSLVCKMVLVALLQQVRISGVAENSLESVLDIINLKLRKFGKLAGYEAELFGANMTGEDSNTGEHYASSASKTYAPDAVFLGTASRMGDGEVYKARGFLQAVQELVETGILFQQGGRGERNRKIRLTISEADVKQALHNDADIGSFLQG